MLRREGPGGCGRTACARAALLVVVALCLVAGTWEGFVHSALYRRIDPLQLPRVLLLYALPGRLFSPTDVVLWVTTQGARGDVRRLARVEYDPRPARADSGAPPYDVLAPGRLAIDWREPARGVAVAEVRIAGSVLLWRDERLRANQAFDLWLVHAPGGWRLFHLHNVGAWLGACGVRCRAGMAPESVAALQGQRRRGWPGDQAVHPVLGG